MSFAVKNDEFWVRIAKKAVSCFANIRLVEFEQITHWSVGFLFPLTADTEDSSVLKVKSRPSSYHTTICHVHLSSGSFKVVSARKPSNLISIKLLKRVHSSPVSNK